MKATVRSKTKIMYHDREGKPVIHFTKQSFRPYLMVRTKGGGTKRLYLNTKQARSQITQGYGSLMKQARKEAKKRRKKR